MKRSLTGMFMGIVLCAALTVPVGAQGLPAASPESVGLSTARLGRIAPTVQHWIEADEMAGAVTVVARHGNVAHLAAHGMADREERTPMATDTIFRIMSMTKPVTSTAVMQLYEEGRFLLDDPISDFIPEFANPQVIVPATPTISEHLVPAKRGITIRDLLNHTAGLSYGGGLHAKYYHEAGIDELTGPAHTVGELSRALATCPLLFHPGEDFEYSLCDDVLGYFVEVVSGMPFDEYLETRIFEPLDMDDTFFFVPAEKAGRVAALYRNTADGIEKISPDDKDRAPIDQQRYFSGGGGLYSTAADYARFCQMLLNGGELDGARILSRKTVEGMTINNIGDIYADVSEGGDRWGLGSVNTCTLDVHDTNVISQGAYMKSGAFSTYFWIDPAEDMFGIFLSQRSYTMEFPNLFSILAATAIDD